MDNRWRKTAWNYESTKSDKLETGLWGRYKHHVYSNVKKRRTEDMGVPQENALQVQDSALLGVLPLRTTVSALRSPVS
jgi:hypothetical protein